MISGTITDASGRTLSGQTTEAFWNSVEHAESRSWSGSTVRSVRKTCVPYVAELSRVADTRVSALPERRVAERIW